MSTVVTYARVRKRVEDFSAESSDKCEFYWCYTRSSPALVQYRKNHWWILLCDVAAQIYASMPLVSEAQREVFSFLALNVTQIILL